MVLELEEARGHLGLLRAGIRDVDVHDLLHAARARVHDDDALGEDDGLLDVVGDEEAGLLLLLPGLEQLGLELGARLGVKGAERLVHEQDLGVDRVGAGDGDALLHAARELLGVGLHEVLQLDELDVLERDLLGLLVGLALELEAKLDVLEDREPREEGVLLEDDAAVGAGARDLLAVHQDAALRGLLEATDDVQERGLAAAGRPDDAHELVLVDVEVGAVEGNHLALAGVELLDHVLDVDLYC